MRQQLKAALVIIASAAATVGALVGVTALANKPASYTAKAHISSASSSSTTVFIPSTTANVSPTGTVKKIPTGSKLQLGISVLWYVSRDISDSQLEQQATATMDYLVSERANAININFPFYSGGPSYNRIYAAGGTPTPSQVAIVVKAAIKDKLRVTLRPLLDQGDLGPGWRGSIHPSNLIKWFASYENFLKPYLVVAQANQVSTFILGAELNSIAAATEWKSLIKESQSIFHGQTGYSINWDAFHSTAPLPPVASLGVDAYDPVSVGSTASVSQLVAGINQWWSATPARIDQSKIVIDELGIANQDGAYLEPFAAQLPPSNPINFMIQQNWFSAYCQVVQIRHLAGIYYWGMLFDQTKPDTSMMSFVGRSGAQAIKNCFTELSS